MTKAHTGVFHIYDGLLGGYLTLYCLDDVVSLHPKVKEGSFG